MPTPKIITELVERFDRNLESYKSGSYNETEVRNEFINPFFEALGWDVINKVGYAEAYKDVIHEYSLKTKDVAKAPDYLFRVGGTKKFFVEAKKPSVNLKDYISPAFQLRRYAWSAKLQFSILTDFEELAIYDCRIQPKKNDKSSTARITYLTYKDYIKRWDEIESIFSKDAVLKGSFDKFAETNKGKRGTTQVDDAFLIEIEKWRELLARNIALRNTDLTNRQLNYSVQKIIDRIIFLRISEDRGIEDYGQFYNLLNGPNTYKKLKQIFTRADEKYNSGLFHFDEEKSRTDPPDEITPTLTIDDKVLKDIFKNLYYPDCPYEFSVLGADILGHVYEQFLGKVIRLTTGHRAVIEEKPEVKKAGGVYYTPTYIVDYIVKNTVGKKLTEIENKYNVILSSLPDHLSRRGVEVRKEYTNRDDNHSNAILVSKNEISKQVRNDIDKAVKETSKIKILDPACGSGSFLLGAYQYLLDWHLQLYTGSVEIQHAVSLKKDSPIYQTKADEYRLTTNEKKRILLNNIYGVDIDNQAVEVTKLSLLLRVLEGETDETLNTQINMFKERALPDLSSNIKCGNSLIGSDFYDQIEMNFLDDEEKLRINVFDWEIEFDEIMKDGGFDCVIGNPPYVRIQVMKQWAKEEVTFYKQIYTSASKGSYDLYVLFVEKGYKLLCGKGQLGFIHPNKMFNSQYGKPIRQLLESYKAVSEIVNFGFNQIFKGATTYTTLMFLSNKDNNEFEYYNVKDLFSWVANNDAEKGTIDNSSLKNDIWNFNVGKGSTIFEKLNVIDTKLEDVVDIYVGLQTSADDVFIVDFVEEKEKNFILYSKVLDENIEVEKDLFHPIVSGTDIKRYQGLVKRQFVLFPYTVLNEKGVLIAQSILENKYPKTFDYLIRNKERLQNREKGKFRDALWYRFGRNQNIGIQGRTKICVPRLVERLHCAFDLEGQFYLDNVDVGGLTLKENNADLSYLYLTAIINSKLMQWYFPSISTPFRGGWFSANKQFLSKLPIIMPDKNLNIIVEERVKFLLEINSQLKNSKTPQEKTALQRQIDTTDKQIDKLVYELYGLTEEEIKIVEEKT